MPSRATVVVAAVRQATSPGLAEGRRYQSHQARSPAFMTPVNTHDSILFSNPSFSSSPSSQPPSSPPENERSYRRLSSTQSRQTLRMQPALHRMFSANAQWAEDVRAKQPDFFKESAKGQSPKLLWIGCADSRVPETVVMAAKPGDIFVHRNIANQFHLSDDSAQSVLAYAINALGVENVAVVGHTFCGGAVACMGAAQAKAEDEPQIPVDSPLGRWLAPMINLAKSLNLGAEPDADKALTYLVEQNVRAQVANVIKTDTIVNAWKAGKKVTVHGWVYEIERGEIRDLQISAGPESAF